MVIKSMDDYREMEPSEIGLLWGVIRSMDGCIDWIGNYRSRVVH